MALTYEEIRKALAKSKARWTLPDDLKGEVFIHPTGRKIPESMTEEEKVSLKESDIDSILENVRKSRSPSSYDRETKEHQENS